MSAAPDPVRISALARRVRWLDRYRHTIAIVAAVVSLPVFAHELVRILGHDFPRFHAVALAVVGSVLGWWILEVLFAWMAAMWETEHDRLAHECALPEARLLRRRDR